MAKLGDEYQEIVGAVERALDPGAIVRVGVWVVGPDGRRDLDVEVRGTIDGKPHFIQIECKDWADPVGISVVDALDSKRRDFDADRAVIYSNSGFTEPALRKAARLAIGMASALKAGDHRVKVSVHKELIAKRLSVDHVRVTLYPPPGLEPRFPDGWELAGLAYEGQPLQNWISPLTRRLLAEHEPRSTLIFTCTFRTQGLWSYQGEAVDVAAMKVSLECSRSWVAQTVREDVTLGLYDHIRGTVTVPDRQGYLLGLIDQEAWRPFDGEPEQPPLTQNSFNISLTLFHSLSRLDESGTPNLDYLILEQKTESERSDA